eukprot:g1451.t1
MMDPAQTKDGTLSDPQENTKPKRRPLFHLTHKLSGHLRAVAGVKFSPTHHGLGERSVSSAGNEQGNSVVASACTSSLLASCSADSTIRLWDTFSGNPLQIYEGHCGGISDVNWSNDSFFLCSASDDKTVRVWDVTTTKSVATLKGHLGFVLSAKFLPQQNLVASCSVDECIRLWDVRSGTCERILMAHSDPVTSIDFAADGEMIASSSYDGLCRIWHTASGQCLKTIIADDKTPVGRVCFAPNDRYILMNTLDSKIHLWDFYHARCIKTYTGHFNSNFCVASGFYCEENPTMIENHTDADIRTDADESPQHKENGTQDFVFCGSENSEVFFWDLQTTEIVECLSPNNNKTSTSSSTSRSDSLLLTKKGSLEEGRASGAGMVLDHNTSSVLGQSQRTASGFKENSPTVAVDCVSEHGVIAAGCGNEIALWSRTCTRTD